MPNSGIILNDSEFSATYGYGHNYGYINGNAGYYDEQEQQDAARRNGWRRFFSFGKR
jgi:hypothetical protein